MDIKAPSHILNFCVRDIEDKTYVSLNEKYGDDFSYVYKIKCLCGNEKFMVYRDDHPSIFAKCCNCKKMITVYDLSFYPAAVKLNKEFELEMVDSGVTVYVNYEYNDEYMFEDDVEYDENDISWAKAFIQNGENVKMILDDETA